MPDKECGSTIPAGEAIFQITNAIIEQKRVEGADVNGLSSLGPAVLGIFQTFRVENVPVKRDIFIASEVSPCLPEIEVDEANCTISIDGRTVEFRKGRYWRMLLYFVSNANSNLDKSTLREIASRDGKKADKQDISNCIIRLRKKLEDDPSSPKIITTIGGLRRGRGVDDTQYRLNALIHIKNKLFFTDSNSVPVGKSAEQKESKNRTNAFGPRREKVAYTLFALNKERDDFQNQSLTEIVKDAYADILSNASDYTKAFGVYYRNLSVVRKNVIIILGKAMTDPHDKNLPPELLKFLNWLKAQPEYANATVGNLILAAKRKITLAELKNTTMPFVDKEPEIRATEPVVISVPVKSAVLTLLSNREVSKLLEPVPAPVALLTIKPEIIPVKVDLPKEAEFSEKSLDKPPALAIAQIAALGLILRTPIYRPLLKKYGINIAKVEIENEIHTILAICRRDIGDLYTETFLKSSFPLLVQYLKEFTGGDRKAFLDSNSEQAQALLEMIPPTITVDGLEALMMEIEAIISRL